MVTFTKNDVNGLYDRKNFDALSVLLKILIKDATKGLLKDSPVKAFDTYDDSWPTFYIDLDVLLKTKVDNFKQCNSDYEGISKILKDKFNEMDFNVLNINYLNDSENSHCFDEFVVDLKSIDWDSFTKDIVEDIIKIQSVLDKCEPVPSGYSISFKE